MLDVGTETTKEARHEISWGWVCPLLLVLLFLMSWRRKKGPSTCWAKRESISGKSEFCMKASCLRGSSGAQGVTLGWGGAVSAKAAQGQHCWGEQRGDMLGLERPEPSGTACAGHRCSGPWKGWPFALCPLSSCPSHSPAHTSVPGGSAAHTGLCRGPAHFYEMLTFGLYKRQPFRV